VARRSYETIDNFGELSWLKLARKVRVISSSSAESLIGDQTLIGRSSIARRSDASEQFFFLAAGPLERERERERERRDVVRRRLNPGGRDAQQ
jgi:hypothetical protein